MDNKDLTTKFISLNEELNEIVDILNLDSKRLELRELEKSSEQEGFWNDLDKSKVVMEKIKHLNDIIKKVDYLSDNIATAIELCDLDLNETELIELKSSLDEYIKKVEDLKLEVLLSGEFDSSNAFIEIHSGAGGTESNDWANMLSRMYKRYFEKSNFSYDIINEQLGDEVGIKGIIMHIKGINAFGYLKGETGVHRLVRISPFDSNSKRHTSFASVLVTPEINKNIDIDIKESELKVDVYRSSGAGGQSVNTTDSAVRITHLPSGIVVSCQNERSQIKNKEKAMEILKSRIYVLEKEKLEGKVKELKGDIMDVNFGSAIRSYVMCPYTLVKDTRTKTETSNVDKVLDGDIDLFLKDYLKLEKTNK